MTEDNLVYLLDGKVYINLTNSCTNNCVFCIRDIKDDVVGANLFLSSENVKAEGRKVLTSYETSAIFTAIGVPAPKTELAKTPEECGKYFTEMGCKKVVLKIVSP